jgi:hypothetical protein
MALAVEGGLSRFNPGKQPSVVALPRAGRSLRVGLEPLRLLEAEHRFVGSSCA